MAGDNVSLVNDITRGDVSLFMEQLLLAPEGTAWTPGRIDLANPPAGFLHMGAVRDDSPQLTVQKENFQLATGLPMVLRYQTTMRIVGEFQVVFHSNRNSRLITAMGGLPALHFANSPTLQPVVATHSGNTNLSFRISSTAAVADADNPWKKGDLIVTGTSTVLDTSLNGGYIKSIAPATTPVGYLIELEGPWGFSAGTPTVGNPVLKIDRDEVLLGTSHIPYYHLLGVADGSEGQQIVHQMYKASPRGQFVETLRNGQDAQIQGIFDLFGHTVNDGMHSPRSQIVVASRHWFGPE